MLVFGPRISRYDPGGFSALLFVRPTLEKLKKKVIHCLLPPHSPIRAFTQCYLKQAFYDLAITLYNFLK